MMGFNNQPARPGNNWPQAQGHNTFQAQQLQQIGHQQLQGFQQPQTSAHVNAERLLALTEGTDGDEFVIQTLVGEFIPKGENHGRPYYQKAAARMGMEAPEVFIYYWDGRDGPSFEGWWFGKAVGGNEVWSHCPGSSASTPETGWKIPFAGAMRSTFLVLSKSAKMKRDSELRQKRAGELDKEITATVEASAKGLSQSKAKVGDYMNALELGQAEKDLAVHLEALNASQRKLEAANLEASGKNLVLKLRSAQSALSLEISHLKTALPKAQMAEKSRVAENRDTLMLADVMHDVLKGTELAEDAVEKAQITSGMVEHAGDDVEEGNKAAEQTEASAKQAAVAIKSALAAVGGKLNQLRRFETDKVRQMAQDDMAKIRERLRVANMKLGPLLNAKQEFRQRATAQRLSIEVLCVLAPAEVEIDRAEETCAPILAFAERLAGAAATARGAAAKAKAKVAPKKASVKTAVKDDEDKDEKLSKVVPQPDAECVEQSDKAIAVASSKLAAALKLLEQRRSQVPLTDGAMKTEFENLESRAKAGQLRIDKLSAARKELKEREASMALISDVTEKVITVRASVDAAEQILGPFLIEAKIKRETPVDLDTSAVEEALKVATKAISAAKVHVSLKLVEVKRYTADAGADVQKQLQDHSSYLQKCSSRLDELKQGVALHKQSRAMVDAEHCVTEAEIATKAVTQSFTELLDEKRLESLSSSALREAGGLARGREATANKLVLEAQRLITAKQIEAKGTPGCEQISIELAALQGRIRVAQAEFLHSTKAVLPTKVETAMAGKRYFDEVSSKVTTLEATAERAIKLVDALDQPKPAAGEAESPPAASSYGSAEPEENDHVEPSAAPKAFAQQLEARPKASPLKGSVGRLQLQPLNGPPYPKAPSSKTVPIIPKAGQLNATPKFSGAAPPKSVPYYRAPAQTPAQAAAAALDSAMSNLKTVVSFTELQVKGGRLPEDDVALLRQRLAVVTEQLNAAKAKLSEAKERIDLQYLFADSDILVKKAEDLVEVAAQAAAPLLQPELLGSGASPRKAQPTEGEGDEVAENDLETAVLALHSAASAAAEALSSTRAHMMMQRLQLKRLPEATAAKATERFGLLQGRVDDAGRRLEDFRRRGADRRLARVRREAAGFFSEAEAAMATALEASELLERLWAVEEAPKLDEAAAKAQATSPPDEMQAALLGAGQAQATAQEKLLHVRNLLRDHLQNTSTSSPGKSQKDQASGEDAGAEPSTQLAELKLLLERLSPLQTELDRQKRLVNDREHKFVAKRLLHDVTGMLQEMDEKLELMNAALVPLTSEGGEELAAAALLDQLLLALRRYALQQSMSPEDLFAKLGGRDGRLSTEDTLAALSTLIPAEELPEVLKESSAVLAPRLKVAFRLSSGEEQGEITLDHFKDQMVVRYVCVACVSMTDSLDTRAAKTLKKLEVSAVVCQVQAAEKDEATGLERCKVRHENGNLEGFVTLVSNAGTVLLEVFSPYDALSRRAETAMAAAQEATTRTLAYLKQKSEELKLTRLPQNGPLSEVRAELMKMRVRASKAQAVHVQAKAKVATARKRYDSKAEEDRQRRREAGEQAAANELIQEATSLVESLQKRMLATAEQAEKVLAAKAPSGPGVASVVDAERESGLALEALNSLEAELTALLEAMVKAQEKLMKTNLAEIRNASTGPFADARRMMFRLKVKLSPMESSCKKHLAAAKAAKEELLSSAHRLLIRALRSRLRSGGQQVVEELCGLSGEAQAAALRKLLASAASPDAAPEVSPLLEVGLKKYEGNLTRLDILEAAEEYRRCSREIALSSAFEVKSSKTVRLLELGEIVQILTEASLDASTGLIRASCRALRDEAMGWVTLQGNQGTEFMELISKPYLLALAAGTLRPELQESDDAGLGLHRGEVIEVLEGPRRSSPREVVRIRGKAARDGAVGWLTSTVGSAILETVRLFVCKGSIAITSAFDISSGSAVRKLEPGELVELLEEPMIDQERKLTRVRIRCKTDAKEAWATIKGSQGTVFLEETAKHNVVKQAIVLESTLEPGSKEIRTLEVGEAFEILEGPVSHSTKRNACIKGRVVGSGGSRTGWIAVETDDLKPWSLALSCAQDCNLLAQGGEVLRPLCKGESLTAQEVPLACPEGPLLVKVRAAMDGLVGFSPMINPSGEDLLRASQVHVVPVGK